MIKRNVLITIIVIAMLNMSFTAYAAGIDVLRGRHLSVETEADGQFYLFYEETVTVNLIESLGVHFILGVDMPAFEFEEVGITADVATTWYNMLNGINLTVGARFRWKDENPKLFYATLSQLW